MYVIPQWHPLSPGLPSPWGLIYAGSFQCISSLSGTLCQWGLMYTCTLKISNACPLSVAPLSLGLSSQRRLIYVGSFQCMSSPNSTSWWHIQGYRVALNLKFAFQGLEKPWISYFSWKWPWKVLNFVYFRVQDLIFYDQEAVCNQGVLCTIKVLSLRPKGWAFEALNFGRNDLEKPWI